MKNKINSLCPICGEIKNNNYIKSCGKKECSNKLRILTNIEKYGVEYPAKNREVQDKSKQTCLEKYGFENVFQFNEVQEKCKQTNLEKYGTEYVMQSKEIQEKSKQTCLEKYGVEYHIQSKVVRDKSKETLFKNYGVESPFQSEEIQEKSKQTCLERYGIEYYLQSDEIKNKSKKTCLEKYGVENSMQNFEVFEKNQNSGHKRKLYILPLSRKKVFIQGYENKYLDEYFESGGLEENILISVKEINSRLGMITYISLEDNKQHRYYPDFYLIKENKIVEVKSTWYYESQYNINLSKKQACLDKGLDFEFKIYGK